MATAEELQAYEEMKLRAEAAEAERDQLKTNQAKQNSYITKLESATKSTATSQPTGQTQPPQQVAQGGLDPAVTAYLQKKMRDDVVAEAEASLVNAVGKDVYNALKPGLMAYLNANMKPNNTTLAYIIDVFALVHGKAIQDKEHAIHKLGQTQAPAQIAGPGSAAAQLQSMQQAAQRAALPNVMTPSDGSAASGPPGATQGVEIRNTKDAINSLKAKLMGAGGQRFGN